ncbi:DUF1983 domain-containing protein [Pseudescherichia sp.]|uniref:DUF1983 domain-containing protein n=1 Tax=Pseudescherichia sp. TaxID=2055881 RepID=UPI0028A99011|nr:DUF1983 domain-containing protein [Pseudescherichia sp.]
MSNTYQVAEVSVTLPAIGTVSRDDYGNEVKCGAKCRVHLHAVHPDWRKQGSVFDGFLVGSVLTCGYTDMPTHHTRRILMPDGYKLVALSVDEGGMPKSWDSLPVCFVGGFIENGRRYEVGMGVAVEDGKEQVAFKADRFAVTAAAQSIIENAQAIMTNASITATELKPRLSDEMRDAVIDAIRESDVFKALQASQDAQASALVAMQQAIEQTATDAIRNAMKPGGLLYRGI